MRSMLLGLCLALTASFGVARADTAKSGPAPAKVVPQKSLYDRLGGMDAIRVIVQEFLGNVVADKRINAMFANTDARRLETSLVDQICQMTGGPCQYTGKSMREAHKGMKITAAQFNALVEDLAKTLDKFKVLPKERRELLGALAAMKGDIVGK